MWLVVILPALYMASDLSENVMLARMMIDPMSITGGLVGVTKTVTKIKIVLFLAGFAQGAAIMILGLALRR